MTPTITNIFIIYLLPNVTFIYIVQDHFQGVITMLNVQDYTIKVPVSLFQGWLKNMENFIL